VAAEGLPLIVCGYGDCGGIDGGVPSHTGYLKLLLRGYTTHDAAIRAWTLRLAMLRSMRASFRR
jgi:hypothetical protein